MASYGRLLFQKAVESIEDRFTRLSPCELMVMQPHEIIELIHGVEMKVNILITDLNCERNIGIVASKKIIIGERKFIKGIKIKLSMNRMDEKETLGLYD